MESHLEMFSDRLRELLEINSHEIKTVSENTGITCSTLYGYMNGKNVPFMKNALKICDFYQCSLDFLFGFCDEYKCKERKVVAEVCTRLKLAIDRSGKSRYMISLKTHIDQSDISQWYHGKRTPSLISLVTLAPVLKCSLEYLAGREE